MSLFDLDGQVAVVTGSSRGIGKASAEALAAQGARVVISSRDAEACTAVADEINRTYGAGRAIAIAANISKKADLQNLVDRTVAHWGSLGILVCNAATNPYFGPLSGISDDQFRKILDNNIIANHWLIAMATPHMKAQGGGAVVIVSSIGGLYGSAQIGAYNISKAADFQLARNLAVELGPDNIRVNCIAPGLIRTDFARALWEDAERLKKTCERTPLGRIGEPVEIAGAVVFLASKAGTFMSGQSIIIDGGRTIA
jgi:NAD(P)-dependent dehydrogenase (short-subunit alcohol dehydrogenase family)